MVRALTSAGKRHVPFRDSKLTRILQESLAGDSNTFLIVCISPSHANLQESISSLQFGQCARTVQIAPVFTRRISRRSQPHQGPLIRSEPSSWTDGELEGMLDDMNMKLAELKACLEEHQPQSPSPLDPPTPVTMVLAAESLCDAELPTTLYANVPA